MAGIRRKHSPEFKLRAVIEVLRGEKTAAQLAGELGVHPLVLSDWKKHFLEVGVQPICNRMGTLESARRRFLYGGISKRAFDRKA